jgi:hypothetical protein
MQKIDDCKEIRLARTRAGIATCPEKCLQTFRLVVTAQYIYHTDVTHMIPDALSAPRMDPGLYFSSRRQGYRFALLFLRLSVAMK